MGKLTAERESVIRSWLLGDAFWDVRTVGSDYRAMILEIDRLRVELAEVKKADPVTQEAQMLQAEELRNAVNAQRASQSAIKEVCRQRDSLKRMLVWAGSQFKRICDGLTSGVPLAELRSWGYRAQKEIFELVRQGTPVVSEDHLQHMNHCAACQDLCKRGRLAEAKIDSLESNLAVARVKSEKLTQLERELVARKARLEGIKNSGLTSWTEDCSLGNDIDIYEQLLSLVQK